MQKLKPYSYKLFRYALTGEKDFILISVDKLWDKLYNKE